VRGEYVTREELDGILRLFQGNGIQWAKEIFRYGFPTVFSMAPVQKDDLPASFKGRLAQLKKRAENLVFDRYEIHCLCEFRVRDKQGVMQPCWHPTDLAGGSIKVKGLNEFVKKVGPALKATAVVLQVVGVALNLAGIPFPKISAVSDMISGYVGQ